MKKLIQILSLVLAISVFQCQPKASPEQAKKEILGYFDKWLNAIIEENLDDLLFAYPDGHSASYMNEGKFRTLDYNSTKKSFSSQFEKVDFTGYTHVMKPEVTVSSDGKMAWVIGIITFNFKNRKSIETKDFSMSYLEVYEKINGKWLMVSAAEKFLPKERETITVNIKILREYEGKYKSESSGLVYNISAEKNRLLIKGVAGNDVKWFPQTESCFYTPEQKNAIVFVRNDKGKVTHYLSLKDGKSNIVKKIR